jgi:hypothetical protein
MNRSDRGRASIYPISAVRPEQRSCQQRGFAMWSFTRQRRLQALRSRCNCRDFGTLPGVEPAAASGEAEQKAQRQCGERRQVRGNDAPAAIVLRRRDRAPYSGDPWAPALDRLRQSALEAVSRAERLHFSRAI